jgi:acyl transferase domain-containing protein
MSNDVDSLDGLIAVIGMAGRFPGAATLEQFWMNLRDGVESIRDLTDDELDAAGASHTDLRDPAYVRRSAPLEHIDMFDAPFWGMSPRDAAVFDPQHRLFLECAWETFEHAGYVGEQIDGAVAVFAACGLSEYMFKNVLANAKMSEAIGEWLIRHTGNDTNFLATRVSYELNLRGPSMNVQTACSSSLVAVHLACQSLLAGECDMALAGGIVVAPVQHKGYFYKEGEILSPDGHCRAFDANSAGTIISSAGGCVLLKPLAQARADGDQVLAVIRGSAINNDGNDKVGYLAPSVSGQSRAVTEALAIGGVDARDVSYVEAHGTGTLIGDPIEIAGLTEAFRQHTDDTGFCAIGSLKTNIGHAGEASGIAGFIKAILAMRHGQLPPSLHFRSPNPQCDFPNSPFFVNAELTEWIPPGGKPRIAGITGLGAGGTNAHIVFEEGDPAPSPLAPARAMQLVALSARTEAAVDAAATQLADHLDAHPELSLVDVAHTHLAARTAFSARRAVVAANPAEAAAALRGADGFVRVRNHHAGDAPSVVFMMPGGGAQYASMGRDLYEHEAVFRAAIDECARLLQPTLGADLRALMYPPPGDDVDEASRQLERPTVALPALFATEWAMAQLLKSWGVEPAAVIGHSAGEYVAAALAGVISLRDGLELVALRGRLFETLPKGGMLSVSMSEGDALQALPEGLSIAAVNSPSLCVVAGPVDTLNDFEASLSGTDVSAVRVHIDVAAHSAMLDPILAEFGAFCRTIRFQPPTIPYVSNVTGTWVTAADVTDPDYWVRHLRHTVRFADGIATVLGDANRVLLEVGPGRTLATFARDAASSAVAVSTTMRHPRERQSDVAVALGAVGAAWCSGAEVDLARLMSGEQPRRIPLPTYPFQRQRHWVDPDPVSAAKIEGSLRKRSDISEWFATVGWERSATPSADAPLAGPTMVIDHGGSFGDALVRALPAGSDLIRVRLGRRFARTKDGYEVTADRIVDWTDMLDDLRAGHRLPTSIVHASAVGSSRSTQRLRRDPLAAYDDTISRDHASLLLLAQALSGLSQPMRLLVVTSNAAAVDGDDEVFAERALLHGGCRVIPRELQHVSSLAIDVPARDAGAAAAVIAELGGSDDDLVAYRRGQRWTRRVHDLPLPLREAAAWRNGGVYLITGGLGGIGLAVGEHIASSAEGAVVALVGRTALPNESTWDATLADRTASPELRHRIETVRRMRAAGATVHVIAADITDRAAMETVVADLSQRHGRITGVIHSAGVLRDALIGLRTPTASSPVVEVKARGLLILDEVLRDRPPELLVLFSSVSSLIGLPGQIDYTAANAFLDGFAAARRHDQRTRTVVVNWNAWQEVGMAVRAADAPTPTADKPSRAAARHLGWFDEIVRESGTIRYTALFSRARDWVIDEHVVRHGEALLPGTGFVELMRAAASDATRSPHVALSDVTFLSPFVVGQTEERALHVVVDDRNLTVTVFSDDENSPHALADIAAQPSQQAGSIDVAAVRARCRRIVESYDGYSPQPFMDFGPRWGNLRGVAYGEAEALIDVSLPAPFADEVGTYPLHPAVLDMATGSAQGLIPNFAQTRTFYVPFTYGRISVVRPLPPIAVSHVRLRPAAATDTAVFDITIADSDGNTCVVVDGFTMRLLAPQAQLAPARPNTSVFESPIDAALREGILPFEGVDALNRALCSNVGPQIIASSVDVRAWIARVDSEAAGVDDDTAASEDFDDDDVGTAPGTPIEREIAALWRELLGVRRVGRDDDFFELGGQSLIAVRLFARLRKKYDVDLPLSTLFEAPTVAQCAAVIAARLGIDDQPVDDSTLPEPAVIERSATAEFRSLVTIQRGGDRLPFFCVHGAGGNVLNFRDLSKAMGRSQPFYGLQARGVDGVLRPHRTIEEMASAYLDEVRAVQPGGPYLLGGYSGGGLVAFEMAQQLRAAGQDTALVVLIDTYPPIIAPPPKTVAARLGRLRDEKLDYARDIIQRRAMMRREAELQRQLDEVLAGNGTVPSDLRETHMERTFGEIAARYVRMPYQGRVVLLRAQDVHFAFRSLGEAYGWDEVVTDGFELIRTPGNHATVLLEPNAEVLVTSLGKALDEAQTNARV